MNKFATTQGLLILLTACSWSVHSQSIPEVIKDSLRSVICKMLSEDRRVRESTVEVSLQKQVDSINFSQLTAITKKFGFPNKDRIGQANCSGTAFIILLHNPDRLIQKENQELYISECEKGNISGFELGMALDRYSTHSFKKSIYGLYPQVAPCIEDFEMVNTNRKKLLLKALDIKHFKTCQ